MVFQLTQSLNLPKFYVHNSWYKSLDIYIFIYILSFVFRTIIYLEKEESMK